MKAAFALAVGLVGALTLQPVGVGVFDQTHAAFDTLLKRHVHEGLVDYATLTTQSKPLENYLATLAAVPEDAFRTWSEKDRLAFLINLYNAATLQLIVDHYPVKSIKDIGSLLKGPWDQPVVRLFGRGLTLNDLEHKMLRVEYGDPRIHFALVCAARGCPPLRDEAYVAERLDAQLDDQARQFLATSDKNRIETSQRTVYLSPIFKWYGGDFERKSGSVLAALKPYWPSEPVAGYEDFKIRYTEYDWSLNEQTR